MSKAEKDLVEKIADFTEQLNAARSISEDRFTAAQTLAKQLANAEDKIKDLMEEIRMYEHETSTLRHIIIDALRGN